MQQMGEVGGYCNGWLEGVATNGRGGTGKMQLLFTVVTVNVATRSRVLYEKLQYSPLRTLCCVLLKHVSDWAKTQVVQEEVPNKA